MHKFFLLFLLFTFSSAMAQTGGRQANAIILDTDIGPDYDDVGAMAVMHALADRGEAKPLAVISCNKNELVVPTIEIINTFFGRPELPTGAPKGTAAPDQRRFSEMA
ncbi:hypothetical protein [Dyadobacter flavalbus]|uniref:hypothetical protein n=1 Tax=Dyadobacter flavalbus TaxID=2579942 RepID=UPI001E4259B2|nr:hypothetical protein [Dyadobacter flavalbus]